MARVSRCEMRSRLLAPSDARACGAYPCMNSQALPRSGSLPANAPGIFEFNAPADPSLDTSYLNGRGWAPPLGCAGGVDTRWTQADGG